MVHPRALNHRDFGIYLWLTSWNMATNPAPDPMPSRDYLMGYGEPMRRLAPLGPDKDGYSLL
jgi:hypothetical protein